MSDKILMKNMGFYGYHGVFEEENKLGQKFFIDAVLELDTCKAGHSDDMHDSVSYGDVYQVIKSIVEGKPFNLLEALAENIAESILTQFGLVDAVLVTVKKPEAPVPGMFDYFGVEIYRGRNA
jgi:dihydroneopterin aldolase